MANVVTGRLHDAGRTETITGREREMKKRTIVLDASRHDPWTGERRAEDFPSFELIGDRTSLPDAFAPGQLVQVWFDVRGRRYADADGNIRYFNTLSAYRMEAYGRGGAAPSAAAPSAAPRAASAVTSSANPASAGRGGGEAPGGEGTSMDDDLPF